MALYRCGQDIIDSLDLDILVQILALVPLVAADQLFELLNLSDRLGPVFGARGGAELRLLDPCELSFSPPLVVENALL